MASVRKCDMAVHDGTLVEATHTIDIQIDVGAPGGVNNVHLDLCEEHFQVAEKQINSFLASPD